MYGKLKKSLGMKYDPVAVKLIFKSNQHEIDGLDFNKIDDLQKYCEYVKRAALGECLMLKRGDFSCVTGEIMLGFKEPETIVINKRLEFRGLKQVILYPVNKFNNLIIDSIILIVSPRNCMDIIEAYSNIYNKPLRIELGPPSGVCSDVTAQAIKKQDVHFSFLCVGSRIFAGFDDCELLCGIPAKMTHDLIKEIESITEERKMDIELMKQLNDFEKNLK